MNAEKVCPDPLTGHPGGVAGVAGGGPLPLPPLPAAPGEVETLRAQVAILSDRLAKLEPEKINGALAYCVTVCKRLDAVLSSFDPVLQEGAAAVARMKDPKTGKVSASFWESVPWPVRKMLGK